MQSLFLPGWRRRNCKFGSTELTKLQTHPEQFRLEPHAVKFGMEAVMYSFTALLAVVATAADPSRGVLLDFSATWCGPCQQMNPIVHRLEQQGLPIRQVDIDREPGLASKYGIRTIPAFVLVIDGKEAGRISGTASESQLRQLMARIPRQPAPRNDVAATRSRNKPANRADTRTASTGSTGFEFPFGGPSRNPRSRLNATAPVIRGASPDATASTPNSRTPELPSDGLGPAGSSRSPRVGATGQNRPGLNDVVVRLRVKNGKGLHFGTGTVIHSQPQQAIILTCGHIFRDLSSSAEIEVDLFRGDEVVMLPGAVIDYDLESDVGLLSISPSQKIPAARLADSNRPVKEGDRVQSIGCGGGEAPTVQRIQVTGLNRYLGPENIECTGVPVPGRSGGGLFNERNEVIGLCVAADRPGKRGLFMALPTVCRLLQRTELTQLIPAGYRKEFESPEVYAGSNRRPERNGVTATEIPNTLAVNTTTGSRDTRQTLEQAHEAEIVCIVRPLDNPQAASRVIIINRASEEFVDYLTNEVAGQPQPTSEFVPTSAIAVDADASNVDCPSSAPVNPPTAMQPPTFQRYRRRRSSY